MSPRVAGLLCLVLATLFAGPGWGEGEPLRMGVYHNPPLIFAGEDGRATGFIPALLNAIGESQGWEFDYRSCNWRDCLSSLEQAQLDLVSPIAASTDRNGKFDVNEENLLVNWGQLYARGNLKIHSIPELDGHEVAVKSGDIHYTRLAQLARRYEIQVTFLEYAAYDQVVDAVARREADAGLVNRLYASGHRDIYGVNLTPVVFNPVGLRVALPRGRPGNTEFIEALDGQLARLKADPDSLYYQVLEEWLGQGSALRWPLWLSWVIGIGGGLILLFALGSLILELLVRARTRELRAEIDARQRAEAEERALDVLLRLSLQSLDMDTYLQRAIETLLDAVPWLALLPEGGIFLAEGEGKDKALRLVANHNLAPELRTLCARVPFDTCLCGRAASSGQTQFADCVDHRHEIRFDAMAPHGHYNLPIMAGQEVLGVVVLYLPHGHARSAHEEGFLDQVAGVLCMGISRRRDAEAIEHMAYYDLLTGLPNRRLLLDRLQHDMLVTARHSRHGAVLFLDLDRFKIINDTLGHAVGDQLLQEVAERLRASVRAEDSVARLGGDEFVVILPELSADPHRVLVEVRAVADKLRGALAAPFDLAGHNYQVTASIGIALFPGDHERAEDILRCADTAMYQVKANGRDGYRFFDPGMQAEADSRLKLECDLRNALKQGQMFLAFQPQVDADGIICGAEVLLRWQHPELGLVPPARFIPVAEEAGLIFSLGEWVLETTCRQLKTWMDAGGCADSMRYISVNVSPLEFQQADFVKGVERILSDTGVDPGRLAMEITEGSLIADMDAVIGKLAGLKRLGIHLSIDDFGTGYSSLSYIKRLPLDTLKIDQSFVRDIDSDPNDAAIVDTIIAMAQHLGLEPVAEGVENEQQLEFLRQRGCRTYQGYLFSKPVTAQAFHSLICPPG